MPIDLVHAEKVKFKAGDNGKDRLKKNAVHFRNVFHRELRTVSADIGPEYYGVVSFPIYGEGGLKVLSRLRECSLKLYGRVDLVSLTKAFYRIMSRADFDFTAAVKFDIIDKKENKVEKTWEVAR